MGTSSLGKVIFVCSECGFVLTFWLRNRYETYFKPVEKAREQEMERVRDEVDTEDAKK